MNTKSLIISIVVVFIAVTVTDILIHGVWLSSLYGANKELWRPEADMSSGKYMGWLHAGHLLVAVTFTMLWAVGFAQNAKIWPFHLFRVMRSDQKCVKEHRWTRKHGKSCWA